MNERIRELAEQQGLTGPNYLISSQELEKFAELIVRECADFSVRVDLRGLHKNSTLLATLMKKHFGVE